MNRFYKTSVAAIFLCQALMVTSAVFLCSFKVQAQTNFATLSSDGAWCWFSDPRAVFHNGELYFGYVRAADGKTVLSVLDLQSGKVTDLWTSSYSQRDDHDAPALLTKEDGRMLAIYSRHLSDPYFFYRLSNSTHPIAPADWSPEHHIPNSGASMTYANPAQLSAESGKIYNFCRNQNYNPTVYTSTDDGVTWSAPQVLIENGSGNVRPYVKYASNHKDRIDFLYTDGHPREVVTNSLYEMYYRNGAFYKTDGTFIKSDSNLPILHQAEERGSVIYQYSTAPQSDPNEWIPGGRSWCWGVAYQTNGAPACVFSVQLTNAAGPTRGLDDRIYYYYARWTGTNWQKRFIAQGGRPLYAAENDYAGGICLDPQNVNTVYLASDAANPFDLSTTKNVLLGAHYELWRGVTTDGGLTFHWQDVTPGSTVDNLRPYVPRRNGGEPCVLWFRGTYDSYTSFNTEIVGLFTTQVPQTNAESGTWDRDGDGTWGDTNNWLNGIPASGAGNVADFSALDITANRTVTLGRSQTIGTLRFGDVSGHQGWTVDSSDGSVLTLASGAPSIEVNDNTATLAVSLAGTSGFTKSGPGTLVLAASNSLSGTLNLDSGSSYANDGAVRINSSAALADVASPINLRNNSGSEAVGSLQLNGANGAITVAQNFSMSCRNNDITPTFENLAGTNTLAGTNFVQVGGTNVIYQANTDSLLRLSAPIEYVGSLHAARNFVFTGDGNIMVSGPILAAANGVTPVGVVKSGSGRLTLAGANTYANGTSVRGGTLCVEGSLGVGPVTVTAGTLGGTGAIAGSVTVGPGATLAPGDGGMGALTINNALAASGVTRMKLQKASNVLVNDLVRGVSTLHYGGTLQLVAEGEPLGAGDSFRLFSAANYTGAFARIVPATPGVGLVWEASQLGMNGTLSVGVGAVHPRVRRIQATATNVIWGGSGGAAASRFSIMSSTNIAMPLSAWTVLGSGVFDAEGDFFVTNRMLPDSARYYAIRIP